MEAHANLESKEVLIKTTVGELNEGLKLPNKVTELEGVVSAKDNEISKLETDKIKLQAEVDRLELVLENADIGELTKEVERLKKEVEIHQYYLGVAYTNRNNFQSIWDEKVVNHKSGLSSINNNYELIDNTIKEAEAKGELLPPEYYQLREELSHERLLVGDIVSLRKDADAAFVDPFVPEEIRKEYESKLS
ncbi:hypothetical protein BELINDA_92 [Bacillus phage Belinda]|uniref:hypothetical protein n=1 Tax=Bacillus phage Belinda TaxID=1852564 RepID=UPI0007F0D729|nr:hypothetical protein BI039_gp286 [Bacillus phage Belinda]ANM46018.1 hypothetical protein BELINDA_92 [Bacillus phage Belinda]